MNLLKILNLLSDVNARIMKNIYKTTLQSKREYGTFTFRMMVPSNIDRLQVSQNQGMRLNLGVLQVICAKMMRHELQMLPVERITTKWSKSIQEEEKTQNIISITHYNQQETTKLMDH